VGDLPHDRDLMTSRPIIAVLAHGVDTLKFKVCAMTICVAVLAALASAELSVATMRGKLTQQLLDQDRESTERMAVMLASELGTLKLGLEGVAQKVTPSELQDPAAMGRILVEQSALSAVFDSVFAANHDGTLLARTEQGMLRDHVRSIAGCAYFKRVLQSDTPIVSDGLNCQSDVAPSLYIAAPVFGPGGSVIGTVIGSLKLTSARLFSNIVSEQELPGANLLVVNRAGIVLADADAAKILGDATAVRGLSGELARWRAAGSPIDPSGAAKLVDGYMVSMAGSPTLEWMIVHVTPEAVALAPVFAAEKTAWRAATGAALIAAMLGGWLAWHLTQPISRLRARASTLLSEDIDQDDEWPAERGEVGELANAFKQVVAQRRMRQCETQSLLIQQQAVLDHADVGIALTRRGRFEVVSQQFCTIFRASRSSFVGASTRGIYASDEAYQALLACARLSFKERGTFDGEFELVRREGQPFWARIRGRCVAAEDPSQGIIWTLEDVTVSREQRERLSWTSSHDSLTGLTNRAAFERLLESASAHASERPFCVLFIDLDHFKQVNDAGGHAAGDAVLRELATVFISQVRKSDTIARLGGDEFAVLLDQCSVSQAQSIAEKLRAAVSGYELAWEGETYRVGTSIGLVEVNASLATGTEILRAADGACYVAKREGRDRVALHLAR
jgi:diguanylate cyclase (GGDEF)-like protein/PAS domain S-box-containing protein